MKYINLSISDNIATITLSRGKVNALNEQVVEQLRDRFKDLEIQPEIKSIILTGKGKFFSFGFDIPEFLKYSQDEFIRYLKKFAELYLYLFLFPKPIIAALNGHTIAGGCMLATACDHRIMVGDKASIALNELSFGSSVFTGSIEILKFCVGTRNAQEILYSGRMYSAQEAAKLGLVDQVSTADDLENHALAVARDYAVKDARAFASIKKLMRNPMANEVKKSEDQSIGEFVDIWYSQPTWSKLKEIKIHS